MTPPKRSLLRLDLKDLGAARSTPARAPGPGRHALAHRFLRRRVLGHFGLASVAAGVALGAYALINAPSASTSEPFDAAQRAVAVVPSPSPSPTPRPDPAADTTATVLASLDLRAHHGTPPGDDSTAAAPVRDSSPAEAKPAANADYAWVTATVKKRDTLSRIFERHGLRINDAYAVVELDDAAPLRSIRPGQKIQLAMDDRGGALAALRYGLGEFTTLHIAAEDGRFTAEVITRTPEIRLRGAKAVIQTSLLRAAKRAGIGFETIYDLAQLFDWQIDFAREIQRGDQFAVIFEERYVDGEKVGNGDIIAAELIASGRRLRAVRHVDEHGRRAYYAPNGDGIERSFLRSPVKFGRITSNFTHKRFHPILKKWRAHRGVDYGVARGTEVRSTGDGVVTLAGNRTGYGKTVTVRHGAKYTTLYAHLRGFAKGIKTGARVKQGDVIGYVGSTGWATGAHLHYEFRVGGVHRNPLTVELPSSDPIAERYKPAFLTRADAWVAKLAHIGSPLAQLDIAH